MTKTHNFFLLGYTKIQMKTWKYKN